MYHETSIVLPADTNGDQICKHRYNKKNSLKIGGNGRVHESNEVKPVKFDGISLPLLKINRLTFMSFERQRHNDT